jgi:pSer/pThr/pTyr-binding forkhead associated (FHA) protein
MHVRLKVTQGSNAGRELKIPTPQCVIGREGRDKGVDLQINNDAISRKHCVIATSQNEVVVRDLNSRNGTFVNEERVSGEAVLLNGDILRVGTKQFELVIEQSVSKPKLSKVADIKEAVARAAEVGGGSSSTADLDDVNSWLDEADTQEKSRRTDPETRQFRLDDTVAPVAATSDAAAKAGDTKTVVVAPKKPDKKEPGKLPPRPTTSKADSREAAADMLKKFFNRR